MNPIEKYFNAEKSESLLFVLVGIAAIGAALYFILKLKQPFYNGMAYPLIAVALIQIIVGTLVYFRSPKDIERVNQIVQNDKPKIQSEEIPRMEVVMKNFVIYRWIEILLILTGLVLAFMFPTQTFWKGVGIGLAIQASFMLLLDYFAESRGAVYLAYLKQIF
jgi:phosphate/sulfate permease